MWCWCRGGLFQQQEGRGSNPVCGVCVLSSVCLGLSAFFYTQNCTIGVSKLTLGCERVFVLYSFTPTRTRTRTHHCLSHWWWRMINASFLSECFKITFFPISSDLVWLYYKGKVCTFMSVGVKCSISNYWLTSTVRQGAEAKPWRIES